MTRKKNLSATLTKAYSKVQKARSKQDLVDAINLLKQFPAPIKDQTRSIKPTLRVVFFGATLLCATFIAFYTPFKGAAIFPFFLFIFFVKLLNARTHPLEEISYFIHYKNFLLENDLKEKEYKEKVKILLLKLSFKQFSTPSKNEVMYNWLDGAFAGAEHTFKFNYFHYHYEYGLPSKYDIYFSRCGIMMKFNYASHIYIGPKRHLEYPLLTSYYPLEWISPSVAFNKQFMVQTNSKIDATKFLKPFLLETILNLERKIPGLALELSSHGILCLSFDQQDIVPEQMRYGLKYPLYFSRMIEKPEKGKKFNTLMNFIHTLMKYSDNNFDKNIHTKTGST